MNNLLFAWMDEGEVVIILPKIATFIILYKIH